MYKTLILRFNNSQITFNAITLLLASFDEIIIEAEKLQKEVVISKSNDNVTLIFFSEHQMIHFLKSVVNKL